MRYLPHALVVTTMVAIVPVGVSVALRRSGAISSVWLATAFAVALSFAASFIGSLYWRERRGAGELLFSELLLWGWLRLYLEDLKVARATRLLECEPPSRGSGADSLDRVRRQQLLGQLAAALEGQDPYLRGHSRRVARRSARIAASLGLPSEEVARVRAAALIHDVGKLRLPPQILNKPARLSDAEFDVIRVHPVDGAELSLALGDPALTAIVRHHHERLDGSGYPDHLTGAEIPLGARIVAVADTFDAITSTRAYRPAACHKDAIGILRNEAGSRLDPAAVSAFLDYYSGHRAALAWVVSTAMLRRGISWLTGDPAAAAPIASGKLAASVVATAALGSVVAITPVIAVSGLSPLVGGAAAAGENPEPGSGLTPAGMRAPASRQDLSGRGVAGAGSVSRPSRQTSAPSWSVVLQSLDQTLSFGSMPFGAPANLFTAGSRAHRTATAPAGAVNQSSSAPGGAPSATHSPGAPAGPHTTSIQPQQGGSPPASNGHHGGHTAGGGGTRGGGSRGGHRSGAANGNAFGRGRASGHSATAPGHSGTAPGLAATAPGQAATAPGLAGTVAGQSGTSRGHSATAPGHSGTAPGLAGTAPGQSGAAPGLTGGNGNGAHGPHA